MNHSCQPVHHSLDLHLHHTGDAVTTRPGLSCLLPREQLPERGDPPVGNERKKFAISLHWEILVRPWKIRAPSYKTISPGWRYTSYLVPSSPSAVRGQPSSQSWSTWTTADMMWVECRSMWSSSIEPRWYIRIPYVDVCSSVEFAQASRTGVMYSRMRKRNPQSESRFAFKIFTKSSFI